MKADEIREHRRLLWLLMTVPVGAAVIVQALVTVVPAAQRHPLLVYSIALWSIVILVAAVAARGLIRLSRTVPDEVARAAALERIRQLEAINALMHRLASTPNVHALFKALAAKIGDVVPCDRVAVALTDTGHEFQVYLVRTVPADTAPADLSPDPPETHHFLRAGTLIAEVVEEGTPRVLPDLSTLADRHLDATVLASAGLRSALLLPLTAEGLSLGVLMALSKTPARLTAAYVDTLRPVADIIAVAFATQRLARALGRSQMAKDMADVMFSLANEINGALQAIVGHCELLSREYPDPALQRDLAMVSRQAIRATEVLTQVQGLAEARMQRATSVANLLEDARLDEPVAGGDFDDLRNR